MTKPISNDLRSKILAAAKSGKPVVLTEESDRDVPASFLLPLLTGSQPDVVAHNRTIHLIKARITGEFDFSFATLVVPFILEQCEIVEPINMPGVIAPYISMKLSTIHSLNLSNINLRTDLNLSGATVGRAGMTGPALALDGAKIGGSVFLSGNFYSGGEVNLSNTEITGQFVCTGGTFDSEGGRAIYSDGAKINGGVFLNAGFQAKGIVRFPGADIKGPFVCTGGSFNNEDGTAFIADEIDVEGGMFFDRNFHALGEVRIVGAHITGPLICRGGVFENNTGKALLADRIEIGGSIFLNDGFRAFGEVRLPGANIGGQLNCKGGIFENPTGYALAFDNARIGEAVFLDDGFHAQGIVRFPNAHINGELSARGGKFDGESGHALNADGVTINGNVFLNRGFHANGEVRFSGATINGLLECNEGIFENEYGDALCVEDAHINNGMLLENGFTALGNVRLEGTNITDRLSCLKDISGGKYLLDRLAYGSLQVGDGSAKDALEWVRNSQPHKLDYSPSPYEQLAEFFDRTGQASEAINVRIANQRAHRRSGQLSVFAWVASILLDKFTGYGWKQWRLWLWLGLAVMLFGWLLFHRLGPDQFVLKDGTINTGVFYPLVYSVDSFLPLVDLGQENNWRPNDLGPSIYLWIHILLGWLISTLAIASFTGILRRR